MGRFCEGVSDHFEMVSAARGRRAGAAFSRVFRSISPLTCSGDYLHRESGGAGSDRRIAFSNAGPATRRCREFLENEKWHRWLLWLHRQCICLAD